MKTVNPEFIAAAVVALSLAGCGPSNLPAPDANPAGISAGPKFTGPASDAGLEVKPSTDTKGFVALVKSRSGKFHSRPNPFALTSTERTYDSMQSSERIFNSTGFTTLVEAKSEVAPEVYVEPQPYRRLSGIVVGDSVVAIIEMGDGTAPQIVRPGSKIPNSPWTVVSIDQDKAVLRRSGNVLPHEIQVRLEVAPPGMGGGSNAGGFPGGAGGFPGGAGGFPGGGGGFPGGGPGGPGFPGVPGGGRGGPGQTSE